MPDINELPDVLDVSDIQKFLQIGRVQAYELVNSGVFHVVRINRRIKISKSVFIKWLEGGCDEKEDSRLKSRP